MGTAYSFVSVWRVPASAPRCWAELVRMITPPAARTESVAGSQRGAVATWWRSVSVEPPRRIAVGEGMALHVRSPLGYALRVHLTLTGVEDGRFLSAASAGDLRGAGSVAVEAAGDAASVVTFHWDVATERRWMNATAFVLRPVFEHAHAHVMRQGERGLRAALSTP
ncbi:hypothetical protein [Microbacterium deminutum]|uniref:DUF1990 domain-containing protein n=1 Tax=Microbacterium deminutum TaxID=344164 RepID=A0ABN2QDG3_9MICO